MALSESSALTMCTRRSNLLAVCHLLLFLGYANLPLSSAQPISFLTDQPSNFTTVPANANSVSISILSAFANTTVLVYSNATSITATLPGSSVPTIAQLPPSESHSFLPYTNTSILVLDLSLDPSSEYHAAYMACINGLIQQQSQGGAGQCNITLTFTAPPHSIIAYTIYHIPQISLNTMYTSQLAASTWHYYALWITYNDLDILFMLNPFVILGGSGSPDVDLWLAAVSNTTSPLVPIFPTDANGSYVYSHSSGEEVVELDAEGGWQDGLYIIGVNAPASTRGSSGYTLVLQSGVDNGGSTGGSGVEVSMFAIVGALVVLVLCLFSAAALIARRRRSYIRDLQLYGDSPAGQTELMHRIQVRALADGRVVAAGPDVYHGASESQIGRLPSHVYAEGEMSAEDAKCTICLDDFVAGESTLKVLHCGHVYHEQCISTWLHTRKHCPLCLQNVDSAQDVAKHDDSQPSPLPASGRPTAALTPATMSAGNDDGVKIEVSAAPSSTVVDSASSGGRRSSSGREDGAPVAEMPNTPLSRAHEERKDGTQ